MTISLWDTPIKLSVSTNLSHFKEAVTPFKNILRLACTPNIMYSASTYQSGKRDAAHWQSGAQVVILDFDEGLSANTKIWLKSQLGFLVPTRNHKKEKGGKVCERYRAILLASTPLNVTAKEYSNIYRNIYSKNDLGGDTSCVDVCRLYYGAEVEHKQDIQVLGGKPLDWKEYNYEDEISMIGLSSTKKVVDITPYEHLDLTYISDLNKSKRYECPICALTGLDPNKHHMGFSDEKDIVTCFYDNENHSPVLRALYRKQVYGDVLETPEQIEADAQEYPDEYEVCPKCQGTGKANKKCPKCKGTGNVTKETGISNSQEPCPKCGGTGTVQGKCTTCKGTGKKKKAKAKVKKESLPDKLVPLRERCPKGVAHFNEQGWVTDFDAELKRFENCKTIGLDVETYGRYEVAVSEEELKEMYKDKYISITATYKRVVKNCKDKALDEIENAVRLVILGSGQMKTAFDLSLLTKEQIRKLLLSIKDKLIIGHNLKFDLKSLASDYGRDILPKRVFDAMLASKMLWMAHNPFEPNENNRLGPVIQRFLGVVLPKDQGASDWGQDELVQEQRIYALNDVGYLESLFVAMVKKFQEEAKSINLSDVNLEPLKDILGPLGSIHPVMALEMRFLIVLVNTELNGVLVNRTAIRNLLHKLTQELEEATIQLGFNPASAPKSLEFVRKIIGPNMESASKEALAPYYHIPEIKLLGDAKKAKARIGLMTKLLYEHKADGRIHTRYTQILSTSRMASKDPNMQQIPRTAKHDVYAAPPGMLVMSADYPAVEIRLGAVYHKEPVMIKALQDDEDLHYKMAAAMTGKKIPKTDEEKHDESGEFVDKEERTAAKNVNFGFLYGSTPWSYQQVQLVKNHIKISDEDAEKARKTFMSIYKVICAHVEQTRLEFKNKTDKVRIKDSMGNVLIQEVPHKIELQTLFGRRLAVESANTALNYPIQGSGADCLKIAACLLEDKLEETGLNARIVNFIHDDTVVEMAIDQREEVSKIFADSMNTAANCLMGKYFLTDVTSEMEVMAETPITVTEM